MEIKTFFDKATFTMTYVVYDEATKDALVIDPVLDYEPGGSNTSTDSVKTVVSFLQEKSLNPHYLLETHAHADHLSGAQEIKKSFPNAQVGIGASITVVQSNFKPVFGLPQNFAVDGSQFDKLFSDGEKVTAGSIEFEVIATPGHTPADVTYKIGDAIFTGDTIFMPDGGTGRCDFPAGSADDLYNSITEKLYTLPDETRVFVGHDYQPGGREVKWETTIGAQKAENIQLPAGRSRIEFVKFRTARDNTLNAPRLLFQSVQVNIDAGRLPEPNEEGVRHLRIPVNFLKAEPKEDAQLTLEAV